MNDIEKIRLKFDIDKKIDLNFDNNNKLKVLMLKGDDGFDPYIISARSGKTTTVTITDYYGTQSFDIYDGVDPTVTASRDGNKTTLTITDIDGTRTADIYDGVDLTGGVPTDGVIGWDNKDISYTCDGTESGDYYLTYNSVDYYFTMPTVEDGDTLLFNTDNLTLKLNGTTISTASSGTGTELTFVEYIPNGYELTNEPFPGAGSITVHDSYSTSTTEPYSANYVNGILNTIYPVGSIIIKDDNTDYSSWLGFTWTKVFDGRVLVGQDTSQSEFDTIGETGGEKTHTLTIQEMPNHNHMERIFSENYNDGKSIAGNRAYARSFADTAGGWNWSGNGKNNGQIVDVIETTNAGSGQAHNNLQPYQVVAYWKRTA